jgi:hypothetical protein
LGRIATIRGGHRSDRNGLSRFIRPWCRQFKGLFAPRDCRRGGLFSPVRSGVLPGKSPLNEKARDLLFLPTFPCRARGGSMRPRSHRGATRGMARLGDGLWTPWARPTEAGRPEANGRMVTVSGRTEVDPSAVAGRPVHGVRGRPKPTPATETERSDNDLRSLRGGSRGHGRMIRAVEAAEAASQAQVAMPGRV